MEWLAFILHIVLVNKFFLTEVGRYAALITGTSQIFFLYFFDFHTDTVLQTGVVLALWQLAAYLQNKKPVNFIFGFFGIGLAMLTKGPVGAVIPFLAVLFYLLVQKDFRQLFHPKWLLGIFIVLIIISPSLIQLYLNFGIKGLKFYFITNNFGRITGEYAGSSTEFIFYIHTLLWAFLPWTIFVVVAIYSEINSWIQNREQMNLGVYLLASVLVLLVIFSVSKGKAPNYFLITVAPLSVVSAKWLSIFISGQKAKKRILNSQIVFTGLIGIALIFILKFMGFTSFWFAIIFVLIMAATMFFLLQKRNQSLQAILIFSVIVIAGFNLFFNVKVYPELYSYQGAGQALKIYEKERDTNDILVTMELEEYEIFFRAESPVQNISTWENFYSFLKRDGAWIYTNKQGLDVVKELTKNIDTIYEIPQKGMNRPTLQFLNSKTRNKALINNYLIKVN